MAHLKTRLSQARWDLVVTIAVLVYIATLILGIVVTLPLISRFSRGSPTTRGAELAFDAISALLVIVVTGYGAWWAARRVAHDALLHGVLVGVLVALLSFLLDLLVSRTITSLGLVLYVLMVVAGFFGGILGSRR